MLISQYETKISSKFQIAIPKKFREELGDRIIITKGLGKRLMLVSEKKWETLLEGTENSPFIEKDASDMQRFILANAQYVELDSKGRCVLPQYLREHAQIQDEIVFAGVGRYVEIWNKKNWNEEQTYLSENIGKIAEKLTVRKEVRNE